MKRQIDAIGLIALKQWGSAFWITQDQQLGGTQIFSNALRARCVIDARKYFQATGLCKRFEFIQRQLRTLAQQAERPTKQPWQSWTYWFPFIKKI